MVSAVLESDSTTIESEQQSQQRFRSHSSSPWRVDGEPSVQCDLCLAVSDATARIDRKYLMAIA
jgi:hypothetical protein